MKRYLINLVFFLSLFLFAQEGLRDDFVDLESWDPLIFPKIEKQSLFSLVTEGDLTLLKAQSEGGASGLIYKETFNVKETPILNWSWKVDNLLTKGNGKSKKGDDYSIRIYVIFEYDPDKASGLTATKYSLAKLIYGEYPPDSALNYVWANREWDEEFIPNAYSDRAIMINSDQGDTHLGEWREHSVNILEDYIKVFGEEPPLVASIAIMTDSDNTGETTLAYLDYISLGKDLDD